MEEQHSGEELEKAALRAKYNLDVRAVPTPEEATKEALADLEQRRWFKALAFYFLIFFATVFAAVLIYFPLSFFCSQGPWIFYIPWPTQVATALGLTLAIFAAMALSFSLALVKLAESPKKASDSQAKLVTTPLYEIVKSVVTAIKDSLRKERE